MALHTEEISIESHPWQPFVPEGARVLILGTFPPGRHRWSMDFYYPNRTNDFWYMMGLIYSGNRNMLLDAATGNFDIDAVMQLLTDRKIALCDTARKVRRLKGNASDKYLEIVEPLPLSALLATMPECHTVVSTGAKAAGVVAELTATKLPKTGEMVAGPGGIEIWRMPSTSRAYPLRLERKAENYAVMLRHAGCL